MDRDEPRLSRVNAVDVQVSDAAEDATWEWYCSHHGLLMEPGRIPLENLASILGDLVGRVDASSAVRVVFGFRGPHPGTDENYSLDGTTLAVDGPAVADEMFVHGPFRLLRMAARLLAPTHTYGATYRDAMCRLAEIGFTPVVAAHLRSTYDDVGARRAA
jgi:hypothetical protein